MVLYEEQNESIVDGAKDGNLILAGAGKNVYHVKDVIRFVPWSLM